ncbi:MAG TPA: tetratricopeptide repeat protein [Calditrichaeota bacterium]|nr:tetratricopeptide repeat protein [Calditrichota bacterium]
MNRQDILNKGFQRFAERDYERAIVLFRKVLEIDEQFEAAYSALSEALNRMGKIDEAIPVVKKWLDINPNDPLAHTTLSRLYVQKGMIAEAEREMAISMRLASK